MIELTATGHPSQRNCHVRSAEQPAGLFSDPTDTADRIRQRPSQSTLFLTTGSQATGAAFLRFDVLANSTICTMVKEIQLSRPELAFIIATRAILGAGIALLGRGY